MTARKAPVLEQSEAQFQAAVIDLAQRNSWLVAHFHDSRRQVTRKSGERLWIGDRAAAGFPDLVAVRPPRLLFAELKAEKGRTSQVQRDWLDLLGAIAEASGRRVVVALWRPSDWPEIVRVLSSAGVERGVDQERACAPIPASSPMDRRVSAPLSITTQES